jgi:hypothetical protein
VRLNKNTNVESKNLIETLMDSKGSFRVLYRVLQPTKVLYGLQQTHVGY